MRIGAGIGLLSLLITIGLIVWLFSLYSIPVAKEGKKAQAQAQQIAGYGKDDVPAPDSFQTTGATRGSRMSALQVTSVAPGGAMDMYYGLKVGDEITAVAGTPIDAMSNGDEELAKSLVVSEGFQRRQPITVRRAGQSVVLQFTEPPPDNAPPAQAQTPADQSPSPQPGNALQRQLQSIRNSGQ